MVESPLLSAQDEGTGRPCERPLEVVLDLFGQTLMRLYTSAFLYIGEGEMLNFFEIMNRGRSPL